MHVVNKQIIGYQQAPYLHTSRVSSVLEHFRDYDPRAVVRSGDMETLSKRLDCFPPTLVFR